MVWVLNILPTYGNCMISFNLLGVFIHSTLPPKVSFLSSRVSNLPVGTLIKHIGVTFLNGFLNRIMAMSYLQYKFLGSTFFATEILTLYFMSLYFGFRNEFTPMKFYIFPLKILAYIILILKVQIYLVKMNSLDVLIKYLWALSQLLCSWPTNNNMSSHIHSEIQVFINAVIFLKIMWLYHNYNAFLFFFSAKQ